MTIEKRLEYVERELVRARFINRLMAALGIGMVLLMWFFSPGTPTAQDRVLDEVRAKSFTIVDESGNTCVKLAKTGLVILEKNGLPCIMLGVVDERGLLFLFDEKGTNRVGLVITEGKSTLFLSDENGNNRAQLNCNAGNSGLSLSDENGNTRFGVIVSEKDQGLALVDEQGNPIWGAS